MKRPSSPLLMPSRTPKHTSSAHGFVSRHSHSPVFTMSHRPGFPAPAASNVSGSASTSLRVKRVMRPVSGSRQPVLVSPR